MPGAFSDSFNRTRTKMSGPIDISIVIPAFNESRRLPPFLARVISYCQEIDKACEIIIVDDGSSDATFEAASAFTAKFNDLIVIKNERNSGKGYATKKGLLAARGAVRVFLDADGSVGPEEIGKNLHYIEEGYDIFVGSRILTAEAQVLKVKWYRELIGKIFNFFVRKFLFADIKDTQCGFKMFKGATIEPLFSRVYLRGFGFDIEFLYLAFKLGYKVKEGAVSWRHVPGSKINIMTDSIRMFFNILQVRNWHCTLINRFAKHMGPDEYRYMYEMEEYHWWFVSRRNFILKTIENFGLTAPKILDIGSGTGANLAALNKVGKASGVDISEKAVEFCRKRGLSDVTLGPVEDLPHEESTFDIVTCLDVLEHVPDPVKVLREMRKVLKNDGKIVVTVPAFRILWSQHDEALCHLRRYKKKALLHDLSEAGLKAEKVRYLFFTSFFVVAPIRLVRRLIVPKGKACCDTTTLPPKFLNEFLKFLFKVEMNISMKCELPLGTSLYAVVSKKEK